MVKQVQGSQLAGQCLGCKVITILFVSGISKLALGRYQFTVNFVWLTGKYACVITRRIFPSFSIRSIG